MPVRLYKEFKSSLDKDVGVSAYEEYLITYVDLVKKLRYAEAIAKGHRRQVSYAIKHLKDLRNRMVSSDEIDVETADELEKKYLSKLD